MCVLRLFRQSRLFTDDKVESAHCGTRLSNSRPPGVSERRRVRGIEKHRGCEVLNTTKLREYSRIQGVDTKYAYVGDIWMPINLIQSSATASKETVEVRHDLRSAENIVCRECSAYWTDMSDTSSAPSGTQSKGILSPMQTLVSLTGRRRLILMWVRQMLIAYSSHSSSSSFGATS